MGMNKSMVKLTYYNKGDGCTPGQIIALQTFNTLKEISWEYDWQKTQQRILQ